MDTQFLLYLIASIMSGVCGYFFQKYTQKSLFNSGVGSEKSYFISLILAVCFAGLLFTGATAYFY